MSTNPIDSNTTDKPTGNLEELFRHHLAEASVPPRPMLWDHIDNSLLVRQNETYRRRLVATRWVAAASLLLATLAGTGWWARRDAAAPGMATTTQSNNTELGANSRTANPGASAATASAALATSAAADRAAMAAPPVPQSAERVLGSSSAANTIAASEADSYSNSAAPSRSPFPSGTAAPAGNPSSLAAGGNRGTESATGASELPADVARVAETRASDLAAGSVAQEGVASRVGLGQVARPSVGAVAGSAGLGGVGAMSSSAGFAAAPAGVGSGAMAEGLAMLAARPADLVQPALAGLPAGLPAVELPADAAIATVAPDKRWKYGASYAVGVFQPNINFSREGADAAHAYNTSPAFGENTVALSEAAAAQYRSNLKGGLSQRITARAAVRLNTRWSLATGLEVSRNEATSATAVGYTGEQLIDLGQNVNGPQHTTRFRYQTAGIPVEVHYATPLKKGWSAYGRVGAVVSALLTARADVDGIPEATRTYSIGSAGTPYRRVLANVRGGAGAQYRPTVGNWTLSVGPVAETGLLSLNAHPAQDFLSQSRAYSVGLEAGMEFGRK